MGVSKNRGTTKSSILIGFSIINHPFWGTPIFGNTHITMGPQTFVIPAFFLHDIQTPMLRVGRCASDRWGSCLIHGGFDL